MQFSHTESAIEPARCIIGPTALPGFTFAASAANQPYPERPMSPADWESILSGQVSSYAIANYSL